MKKIGFACLLLFISMNMMAGMLGDNPRYERSVFFIQNNTQAMLMLTVHDVMGVWENPLPLNTPVFLQPHQIYQNTLLSIKKMDAFENFASLSVSCMHHPRENYLIFAENARSRRYDVSAHIVDGLGSLFVASNTNHCESNTKNGYAYCMLILNDT